MTKFLVKEILFVLIFLVILLAALFKIKLLWVIDTSFLICWTEVVPCFSIFWVYLCCLLTVWNNLVINLGYLCIILLNKHYAFVLLQCFKLPWAQFHIAGWQKFWLDVSVLLYQVFELVCSLFLVLWVINLVCVSCIINSKFNFSSLRVYFRLLFCKSELGETCVLFICKVFN